MVLVYQDHSPVLADAATELLVDVEPTWKQDLQQHQQQHMSSKALNTDPIQQRDTDVQTTERCDAGCQASTRGRVGSAGQRVGPQVQLFMQHVGPTMLAALAANSQTEAGAAGRALVVREAGQQDTARCLFNLTAFSSSSLLSSNRGNPPSTSTAAGAGAANASIAATTNSSSSSSSRSTLGRTNPQKLQVTSVSWSKTGQTLAASFGRYDIHGWCCLPGAIATWNLARLDSHSDSSGRADRLINVDVCVMCCAFHPGEPALLAGGTFNGELIIWDLSREDANAQIAKTDVLSEVRHREPITAVSWQYSGHEARRRGSAAGAYRLFTLGADGRLLVWLWEQLGNPIYGYELRLVQPGRDPRVSIGGSCLAFCPSASTHEEASLLLVGTEAGQLLRCQVGDINDASLQDFAARLAAAAAAPPGSNQSNVELRNAVQDAKHQPFAAPVNGISACPHHRQLAVAAGGDGTLRVLDVLRSEPLLLLEPAAGALMATAWSPSRPLVFAAASANCIHVYDLASKQRIVRPVLQLPCTDAGGAAAAAAAGRHSRGGSSSSVNVLTFNPQAPGMLAAAAADVISIWELPGRLAEARAGEVKLLRRVLDSEDVSALLRMQCIVSS